MRKIKEILRLKWDFGLTDRKIARSCGIGRTTVAEYLRRAQATGLRWPLDPQIDDAHLERLLFPPPCSLPPESRPIPEGSSIYHELRKKRVTLFLLWPDCVEYAPIRQIGVLGRPLIMGSFRPEEDCPHDGKKSVVICFH